MNPERDLFWTIRSFLSGNFLLQFFIRAWAGREIEATGNCCGGCRGYGKRSIFRPPLRPLPGRGEGRVGLEGRHLPILMFPGFRPGHENGLELGNCEEHSAEEQPANQQGEQDVKQLAYPIQVEGLSAL